MTKLFEKALEAVRQLPSDNQDEIARAMLSLAGTGGEPEEIDPVHLPDVLESLAQANADNLQAIARLKPRFAVSINEASVYAARERKPYFYSDYLRVHNPSAAHAVRAHDL